jgi:hypothetical protein
MRIEAVIETDPKQTSIIGVLPDFLLKNQAILLVIYKKST